MSGTLLPYLWTALGTCAFAVRFGLRLADLPPAAAGAIGGWFVFELGSGAVIHPAGDPAWASPTLGYVLAALFIGLYAEIMSAVLKKPATIWIVTAIFPLVPGGGMYFTMLNSVRGDVWQTMRSGFETLSAAGAIASGLAVSSALSRLVSLRSIAKRLAEPRRSPRFDRSALSDDAERRSFDSFAERGDD